uniref:Uncharacterized protein n=1 Tax=Quercus lobata TaxID=97700 RepID=A0A7N2M1Y7_QUELO
MGLRQVSRMNPNAATEIWFLRSKIQHPQPGVKFLIHFRGFRWRSLYALQITCSQFFPFRIHGLADMTVLGHYSCQTEGGRKLMGQPLVHSQRLGSLIAHQPCIYVLDTPGVLVPSILDIKTGLKLALVGTALHWKHLNNRRLEEIRYDSREKHEYNLKDLRPKRRKPPNDSDMLYVEDLVTKVQCALYLTLLEIIGNVEDESDLESLIEQ